MPCSRVSKTVNLSLLFLKCASQLVDALLEAIWNGIVFILNLIVSKINWPLLCDLKILNLVLINNLGLIWWLVAVTVYQFLNVSLSVTHIIHCIDDLSILDSEPLAREHGTDLSEVAVLSGLDTWLLQSLYVIWRRNRALIRQDALRWVRILIGLTLVLS